MIKKETNFINYESNPNIKLTIREFTMANKIAIQSIFQCSICKTVYNTKNEAEECENKKLINFKPIFNTGDNIFLKSYLVGDYHYADKIVVERKIIGITLDKRHRPIYILNEPILDEDTINYNRDEYDIVYNETFFVHESEVLIPIEENSTKEYSSIYMKTNSGELIEFCANTRKRAIEEFLTYEDTHDNTIGLFFSTISNE